jgi:uncharacterized lipoprotein NlpE involved in copper resistance
MKRQYLEVHLSLREERSLKSNSQQILDCEGKEITSSVNTDGQTEIKAAATARLNMFEPPQLRI